LQTVLSAPSKRIGVAADNDGFELKEHLTAMLRQAHYEVFDFGDGQPKPEDDYPDFVVPLAPRGRFRRGASWSRHFRQRRGCEHCRQQSAGRACLIHECFSARQGVEDDDMNVICLGVGPNISAGRIQRRRASPAPSW